MSVRSQSVRFASVSASVNKDALGNTVLSNNLPLDNAQGTLLDKLEYWAEKAAAQTFIAEPHDGQWQPQSYGQFFQRVKSLAAKLATLSLSDDKPLLILAPNSIAHAEVAMAAMYIGVPVSPVSPAYGLVATTFTKLRQVIDILAPGALYVNDATVFAPAVESIALAYEFPILCSSGEHARARPINELSSIEDRELQSLRKQITPETIAKILFTSGSTGIPKGVITTHSMLYSNQVALKQVWPFLEDYPPVLVDWLPWSHTFGGNVCFNSVLFNGGTFYIDDGKPAPHLIGKTIANNRSASANLHFNVPAGIEALLPHLETDAQFARSFYSSVNVIFVAAAALSQKARDRLQEAALAVGIEPPKLLAGWGSTETAPFATAVYFDTDRADNIGLPMPGTEIKFLPNQDKFELCVRGPNVTPGYWRNASATANAYTDDGFYRMGDAGRFIADNQPTSGLCFDGRISENFKLSTGTWVNVGRIRVSVIDALRPFCQDLVVTGHNQADIGVLLILNLAAIASEFFSSDQAPSITAIENNPRFVDFIVAQLQKYNHTFGGSSLRITRCAIVPRMPDIEKNEITDKGYLNQRQMLVNWQERVKSLHAPPSVGVHFFKSDDNSEKPRELR